MNIFRKHYSAWICTLLFILLPFWSLAQQPKFTLSGYVKDKSTGEFLPGVTIFIKERQKGVISNAYGFYSLTLEQGTYNILISYIGYKEQVLKVELDKSLKFNIDLELKIIETKEVEINAEKPDQNVKSTEMSTIQLSMEKVKILPAFMGEVDLLKTIQLLPGVKSGGEGTSGFYVRGGGPDQNLILLDEPIVYNASHLFGFFSVFNSDAIKNVTLIKGGMPANYGSRLASVLDISMKEGNMQNYHAQGGIGFISSRLTLEGPIVKNKSSFLISGRRTYIDLLIKPFISKTNRFYGSGYYFYDLNTKINYVLSDKDRLFLSGYFGRDIFSFNNSESGFKVETPWGNSTASARWNHLFNDKLFLNTTVIFSDYYFGTDVTQNDFQLKLFSGIRDWSLKTDFNYFPHIQHAVKFGGIFTYHIFTPSSVSAKAGGVELRPEKISKQYANEAAIYVMDDYDISERWKVNAGLRYSFFQHIGPYDKYVKNFREVIIDTISYKNFENIKAYHGLEPRISVRFVLDPQSSLKASYTLNYQYMHLTSFATVTLPTDIWVPSSELVKPQIGNQYALGYFRNFKENTFETSLEIYYKDMENLVEYKDGVTPSNNVNDNVENNLTFGTGESYGVEIFLKKSLGKFTGWIGYTLSYTSRTFPDLNSGKMFYPRYDRRHDMSIVSTYELNPKWIFSAVFVYSTGNAVTLPIGRYFIDGRLVDQYGDRNNYRMDPYHRLDLSATYTRKKKKRFESSWNFSIYNVYNRMNPYFIYFDEHGSLAEKNIKLQAKQVSLFPIIPSVTWNFKF